MIPRENKSHYKNISLPIHCQVQFTHKNREDYLPTKPVHSRQIDAVVFELQTPCGWFHTELGLALIQDQSQDIVLKTQC